LQPSEANLVEYRIQLSWSVKTLEIFSFFFCQLKQGFKRNETDS